MRRTNYWRHLSYFLKANYRLLLFLACLLIGVTIGCLVYGDVSAAYGSKLGALLQITPVASGLGGWITGIFSSCLFLWILLAVLLLAGLSVCGAPVAWLAPLLYGLGLGLTEAQLFSQGGEGILQTALLVIPHSLLAIFALLMGCAESLRMTLLLAGQVLPSFTHCGGLWTDFKRYFLRFLIFFGLAFLSAVVDVLLRVVVL